jgi:hypothetical protein
MFREHGGQDHLDLKHSGHCSGRTQLPNSSCRMSKMTFIVCGHAPSCWNSVVTTFLATGMATFCSFCRYCWLVMVPSTKIVLIGPCLMIVHYTVHFAGWSNISSTVWIFRGQESHVPLFTNPLRQI